MTVLTREQAQVLEAFLDSFDLHTTGVWGVIEQAMRDEFGVEDPEAAVDDARRALRGEV